MGVSLAQLVDGKEIGFDELFDKKLAIDAYNWIYQFLTIIRQMDGTPLKDSQGRTTSHLSGLYYRTLKLLETGVKPVFVFDGKPPDIKRKVTDERRNVRAEALKEWQEALAENDFERARKAAQRSATVTEEIIDGSKSLLDAMGVPWIQAPSEGEALCSLMTRNGDVYATASQDFDSLLFGSPRLVRNLSISGKKKRGGAVVQVNPEIIILEHVLEALGINHDQLIVLGILVGTDYNPGGIMGIGPKKALDLVKKKDMESIFNEVAWSFPAMPKEIFDFFKNPTPIKYDIKFREIDEDAVVKIMCDEHEFSEERILNGIKKLKDNKRNQSSLSRWI